MRIGDFGISVAIAEISLLSSKLDFEPEGLHESPWKLRKFAL